jgi:hypothetical protein
MSTRILSIGGKVQLFGSEEWCQMQESELLERERAKDYKLVEVAGYAPQLLRKLCTESPILSLQAEVHGPSSRNGSNNTSIFRVVAIADVICLTSSHICRFIHNYHLSPH